VNIPIQLAFYALLEHGMLRSFIISFSIFHPPDPIFCGPDMPAAPLWDSSSRQFVGLMSVTDFIDILRHYHRRGIPMDELSARTIGEVMSDADGRRMQHSIFLGTTVESDIYSCVSLMQLNCHRFLPVVPPGESRVTAVVSYYDILRCLVGQFREQRRLFEDSVFDLGIGTWGKNCLTAPQSAKLVEVLDTLERADVSAIPVVDAAGKVVGIYSRSDITFLATATDAESVIANLDLTIGQLAELKSSDALASRERLHTCSPRASLQSVFELFAEMAFQRLVAVDDTSGECVGIITSRDLVTYFCSP